jgi:hypothetical protein
MLEQTFINPVISNVVGKLKLTNYSNVVGKLPIRESNNWVNWKLLLVHGFGKNTIHA